MISRVGVLALLLGLGWAAWGQPAMRWQRSFGGTGADYIRGIVPQIDGGLLILAESGSETNAGKAAPRIGGSDLWVLRLDASGAVQWERTYGGTGWDEAWSVASIPGGGHLLGSISSSTNSGTKTTGRFGAVDYWVARIAEDGAPMWDRTFGGTQVDRLSQVLALADGGFLLCGYADSDLDGNKTVASNGGRDGWLIRLDAAGETVWQTVVGGSDEDDIDVARELSDGGFLLAGSSASPPGPHKNDGHHGMGDVWIVRLDAQGNRIWDRSYGGSNVEYTHDLILLPEGDALVLATSLSGISGNKTSPSRGGGAAADAYVLRIDAKGERVWEQTYGGSSVDRLLSGSLSSGGLLMAGHSDSVPSGNKASPRLGWDDVWLVRIDLDGGLLWETILGSGGHESARVVRWLPDGDFVVGGHFIQINDLAPPVPVYGSDDAYLARYAGDTLRLRMDRADPPRLLLQGPTNTWHRLDVSTDLRTWTPWRTNRLGAPEEEVPPGTNGPHRFYRAQMLPRP